MIGAKQNSSGYNIQFLLKLGRFESVKRIRKLVKELTILISCIENPNNCENILKYVGNKIKCPPYVPISYGCSRLPIETQSTRNDEGKIPCSICRANALKQYESSYSNPRKFTPKSHLKIKVNRRQNINAGNILCF